MNADLKYNPDGTFTAFIMDGKKTIKQLSSNSKAEIDAFIAGYDVTHVRVLGRVDSMSNAPWRSKSAWKG